VERKHINTVHLLYFDMVFVLLYIITLRIYLWICSFHYAGLRECSNEATDSLQKHVHARSCSQWCWSDGWPQV